MLHSIFRPSDLKPVIILIFFWITLISSLHGQSFDIVSFSPSFNANVTLDDSKIVIHFSEPIDTTNLKNNIIVSGSFSSTKLYEYVYNTRAKEISITPLRAYFIGEKITVIVTKELSSLSGCTLHGFTWAFNIIGPEIENIEFKKSAFYQTPGKDYLTVADVNHDQWPDALIADYNEVGEVILNDKTDGFNLLQNFPVSFLGGPMITDVDLDFMPEISDPDFLYPLEQLGNGYYQTNPDLDSGFGNQDLNLDGYQDRLTVGHVRVGDDTTHFIGFIYNTGDGTMPDNIDTLIIDYNIIDVEVADFNNDGINDVVYLTNVFSTPSGVGGKDKISILLFDAQGNIKGIVNLNGDDLPDEYAFGFFNSHSISVVDFNKDNYPDIHVSSNYEDFIFINDQNNGLLTEKENIVIAGGGETPHGAMPVDLNGDGWTDLLYTYTIIPENFTELFVLLNPQDPSVTFWNKIEHGILLEEREPATLSDIDVTDFNNDGLPDVAALWNDGLYVYYGDIVDNIAEYNSPHPQTLNIYPAYPNPFNSNTKITFSMENTQELEIAVFDIMGKEVINFGKRRYHSGQHVLIWYGNNQAGEEVSSGTYFWKFKTDAQTKTAKIIYVK